MPTILHEADRITSTDRERWYGHPAINFRRIAQLWTAFLGIRITPYQVGFCMILVKVARAMQMHTRDNLVDIAGYARALERLIEAEHGDNGKDEAGSDPVRSALRPLGRADTAGVVGAGEADGQPCEAGEACRCTARVMEMVRGDLEYPATD